LRYARGVKPWALVLVVIAACGGGGGDDDDVAAADADPFAPDADPFAPDARPPGTPDAAPVTPPLPTCWPTCSTAADCAVGTSTLFDADNYDCDGGKCRWTGCNSTAECQNAFMNPDYACGAVTGVPFPNCWPTCATAADCAITGPLYDADNYDCDAGKCRWTGCNSTSECTTGLMNPDYTCYQGGCWPTCSTAADCALMSTLHDVDNYDCEGGRCVWTGCNSTAECTGALMDPDYVCD
jgi:hypothetical protein